MADYEKIGGGSFGVYKKKKFDWGLVGAVIFWIVVATIVVNVAS